MEFKLVLSSSGLDDYILVVTAWEVGVKDFDVFISKIPSFYELVAIWLIRNPKGKRDKGERSEGEGKGGGRGRDKGKREVILCFFIKKNPTLTREDSAQMRGFSL